MGNLFFRERVGFFLGKIFDKVFGMKCKILRVWVLVGEVIIKLKVE